MSNKANNAARVLPPTVVDLQQDGSAEVFQLLEADVQAAKSTQEKAETQQEANVVLSQWNLTVRNGEVIATDTQQPVDTTNARVLTDFTGAPILPDVEGEMASADATLYALGHPAMDAIGEGSFPEFAALFELVRGAIGEHALKRKLRNLKQDTMLQHKQNAIEAAHERIKNERSAAIWEFGFALLAGVVGALYIGGTQPVISGGRMLNKLWGPQRQVDYYQLLEKKQDLLSTRAEQVLRDYEDGTQGPKDIFKQALDIIRQFQQNRTAEIQRMFGGF